MKLRNRVTQNIFRDSYVIDNKELQQSKIRIAKKKKLKLKKKVKVIEEMSDGEDASSNNRKKEEPNQYSLINPEPNTYGNRRAKIKALK